MSHFVLLKQESGAMKVIRAFREAFSERNMTAVETK